jgi:hypothetical protein
MTAPLADENTFVQAIAEDLGTARILQNELLRLLQRPLAREQVNALPPRQLARLLHDAGQVLQLVDNIRTEMLASLGLDLEMEPDSGYGPAQEEETTEET